jgi:lipopolysaccharide/colanic/teichoic acid biosynthesis glycosyltransferase
MKHNSLSITECVGGSDEIAEVPRWKRVLDVFCILLALPVLLPITCLIALAIKMVSRGPVFFRQPRIGLQGKPFTCWKFRTMRANADSGVHQNHLDDLIRSDRPMTKMDFLGDPRLIPCGAILRAAGLDELPQLINVVRGEMSLVGPRPCLPYEYELYLPWQKRRFDTLPGLTGLWQVSGKNRTTFTEMIRLDILYARNKSLPLDLKIMWKTIAALATQVKEIKPADKKVASEKHLQVVPR